MNYFKVFLFCFYSCLQMYIFMAPGVISFKRKFFTSKSVSIISEILFIYLIPFYGAIEIARVGSMEILKVFWILVVNFVLSLLISYIIASICQKIFKLDERIKQSFNLVCTIPAMGALPLVIGKAFCFPGGPMEGDIYCDSMIGLMMLCYLVVCICVFLLGYILILSDKIRNNIIQEKMMFLWQILVKKSFGEDYTILYLFNKYLKDKNKANLLYEEFKKNHGNDLINLKYEFNKDEKHHHHHHHKNDKNNKHLSYKLGQKSEKINEKVEEKEINEYKKSLSMKVKSINNINLSEKFNKNDINQNEKNDNLHSKFYQENENGKKSLKNINSNIFENESENNNNVILNDSYFMSQVSEESQSSSSSSSSTSSDDDSSSIKDLGSHYYHENNKNENTNSRKNSVNLRQKTFVFENKGLKDEQFCILFEQKESFYPGHHLSREIKTKFDDNTKVIQRDVFFSKSNKHLKVNIKYEIPTSFKEKVKAQNFLINHPSFKLQTHEANVKRHKSVRIPNHNFKINQESFKNNSFKNQNTNTNYLKTEELDLIIEESNKNISEKEIILNYYQSAFDMIESDPSNFNIELITEYESMKEEILRKVHHTPPKFPIVRSAQIDSQTLDILNKEWENFEPKLKTANQSFKGLPQGKIDNQILMAKIYAPPTLGVVIGLILSLSNLRLIIFDSKNHYWSNIVDGLNVIDKAMVAFLFLLIGLSSASTNGLSMNVPLKKKHIIIVFIMRFIIIPGIGLLVIYFWKNVYGKIVEQSLVFRIILFFPWCLPSAPNMAVIVNLTQYFFEEYGYLILLQNLSSVVTLTILYLVYFILIGL